MLGNTGDVDENLELTAPRDPVGVDESSFKTDIDYDSPAYLELIARSLLNKGNNVRLKRAIDKARQGVPVVIAYIGGSITQGAGASPIHLQSYAYRSYERFKLMFAPSDGNSIQLVKAGVGGTPSELGVVRYERDVLRDGTIQPDIVIIEFAVNDADDETRGNCYESLVLKALANGHHPAVILMFSVFQNDWNLQDRLAPIGWHYNLPMVSMKDALVEQFGKTKGEGNIVSKEQYFHDIYHPTNAGHRIMADALAYLFQVTDLSEPDQEEPDLRKTPLIGNDYVNVKLLDRKNGNQLARIDTGRFRHIDTDLQMSEMDDHEYRTPLFPNNWMHVPDKTISQSCFKLCLRCKRLILIFKDSCSEHFGTANIRVDGKFVKKADPHQVNWTHCHAMLLFDENQAKEHTIEIEMMEGHEDRLFTILGFGYVD
ncbi:SGNH/GDSL hydrolase family protein [Paenibacillus urinalis]|uniref:SGNH/GDSL hydrolase family protein n=1 Tax=Paenibacillus urinalis TaxID=521520 RepID=A0ABY7XJ36_9BACL|nr:SGNH/GDSL hydrolase family protein [Paenibacillus urinalis]WDH96334.1 SGNH/GDSL hydrolase family protein [Paenibacillus urinalis]WDI04557.1 SGNH/GDSL hydrolase family protein [Paenibacillus urinalis]